MADLPAHPNNPSNPAQRRARDRAEMPQAAHALRWSLSAPRVETLMKRRVG
jgi:hypothetical protein